MTVAVAPARERLAIVGAGISGLTCAWHLHDAFDVTVFEANDYPGGHTNTVIVEQDDERHAVDTGFIVFNDGNYPNFTSMLDALGVASHPSTMSFSVRREDNGLEYNGTSLDTIFAQRRNLVRPRFLGMLRAILRFNREAPSVLAYGDDTQTVEEYVTDRGYGAAFVEDYLVPMGASIWSCPPRTFRSFPIRFVVEFFVNHAMLSVSGRPTWRVVTGGSARYLESMIRPFSSRLRLDTPVRSVRREASGVYVTSDRYGPEVFDHVVFGCHSNQALALLDDASDVERHVLGGIPYQRNEAVLHTDERLLPRTRRAWAAWNYLVPEPDGDDVVITYNMNMLQGIDASRTYCVTLNGADRIDPATIIDRFPYEHPVFTADRDSAQRRHAELIDVRRTSYCGAYWGYGFHEDGVTSALAVCDALTNRSERPDPAKARVA